MKKQLLTFLLILCSISASTLKAEQFTGSLLWEISGNGLEKPCYIFGTHHGESIAILDSFPAIKNKFNEAEVIIGELSLEDLTNASTMFQDQLLLPDSISYYDFMPEENVALLDSLLINYIGAGLDQGFGKLKPAVIAQTVSLVMVARTMGIDLTNFKPLDMILLQDAATEGKETLGLETIQFQFDLLFNSDSYEFEAESLLCSLEYYDEGVEDLLTLNYCYNNADLAGLENLWLSEYEDNPCQMSEEMADAIIKTRNEAWMEKLPALLKEKPSFVAVGCLHLVGEDGLLNQFHKLGYTVKAVK